MTHPTLDLPELSPLDHAAVADGGVGTATPLDRLGDVTVELSVEVGRTRMTLGEALALGPGSVVTLDQLADQPIDVLVNGRRVARGEVVVVDEEYGVRITEVPGPADGGTEPAA